MLEPARELVCQQIPGERDKHRSRLRVMRRCERGLQEGPGRVHPARAALDLHRRAIGILYQVRRGVQDGRPALDRLGLELREKVGIVKGIEVNIRQQHGRNGGALSGGSDGDQKRNARDQRANELTVQRYLRFSAVGPIHRKDAHRRSRQHPYHVHGSHSLR